MKPIKMFGLAALAALMAMAFVGASSAMAEGTTLCSSDGSGCGVSHLHQTTLNGAKAKLLTSIVNVECDVLFLGNVVQEGAPLVIEGNFTYTNCGSCTVEEVGGGVAIEVLKLGHETADVTGEGEVHVNCSGLNCTYNGEELLGTAKGPLLSSETNGSIVISEQVAKKVSGLFCPSTSKLDISVTSLSATNIDGLEMVCIEVDAGYFLNGGNGTICGGQDGTRAGKYELAWIPLGIRNALNQGVCALVVSGGYFLDPECTVNDKPNKSGNFELGVTI